LFGGGHCGPERGTAGLELLALGGAMTAHHYGSPIRNPMIQLAGPEEQGPKAKTAGDRDHSAVPG